VPFTQIRTLSDTKRNGCDKRRTRDEEEGHVCRSHWFVLPSPFSRSSLKRELENPHGKEAGKQTPKCGREW
jgi:hypothetical protein